MWDVNRDVQQATPGRPGAGGPQDTPDGGSGDPRAALPVRITPSPGPSAGSVEARGPRRTVVAPAPHLVVGCSGKEWVASPFNRHTAALGGPPQFLFVLLLRGTARFGGIKAWSPMPCRGTQCNGIPWAGFP